MTTAPMAADLVPILRAHRKPLSECELEFYDWQLREAMAEDLRATHGKNGVPELPAVDGGAWTESLPGVVVHAALLLGAVASIGMVLP
jgi:hypothetical protein